MQIRKDFVLEIIHTCDNFMSHVNLKFSDIITTHFHHAYTFRRGCPTTLRTYLIPQAMKLIMEKIQEFPEECGFDENRMVFQPLKLVRIVVGIVNKIILGLQDNSKLYEVPLPPSSQHATELTKLKAPMKVSSDAIKNTRRTMEDRMMIIDDFNAYFNINVSHGKLFIKNYGI